MKAGFIGYRNFSEKLKNIFEKSGYVNNLLYFHPKKGIKNLTFTNKLEDLFSCDFIVISSPDWTHGYYLRKLRNYKKYIFCEKIPVINRKDLLFLKSRINPFLYFDFNYRKSELCRLLNNPTGRILYITCRCGNGLALKKIYKNNWRSNASHVPLGVFEVSGFHFFDLLIFCFGRPISYNFTGENLSPYGDSIDNFSINIKFKNRILANLFFSYTSPCHFNFDIVTTECLISLTNTGLTVRGPRETYDKKSGLFMLPPVIERKQFNLYEDSLRNSVNYFLQVVRAKGKFNEWNTQANLLSTGIFLDILNEAKRSGYLR